MNEQSQFALEDSGFARRAVVRLSSIEFWERYSFYNMFALLALFVAAPVARGGMGWTAGDSLRFFGVYLLIVQCAPIVGGYIADRWLSGVAALRLGAVGLLIGHSLMAGPNFIPWLAERATGLSMANALAASGASLGALDTPASLPPELATPYLLTSLCFYGAVLFVAIGNGLFKPVLTVIVGRLPHASPTERDNAFTIFFLFINIGGLGSTLLGGFLADRLGWGWAFAAAAVGMAIAVCTMLALENRYIRPFAGAFRDRRSSTEVSHSTDPRWILALAFVLGGFIISAVASFQSYGMVTLFTDRLVDREIGGFTVPPAWFTALNPLTIMILTPVFLRTWKREGVGYDWRVTQKFGVGALLMALAFASLWAGAAQSAGGSLANPLWVAVTIVIIAAVELLTAPAANASLTRIVPDGRQALAIGLLAAAAGIGAWLSGRIGASAIESNLQGVILMLAFGCIVFGALLLLFHRQFARLQI